VAVNDLLHCREPDTGAGIHWRYATSETAEHFFGEAHIEARAVVAHEKLGRLTGCIAAELNSGRRRLFALNFAALAEQNSVAPAQQRRVTVRLSGRLR
jgi:hypothetical protein